VYCGARSEPFEGERQETLARENRQRGAIAAAPWISTALAEIDGGIRLIWLA
jgi:hypothetical protein